jgi:hypothetical protein
MRANDQINTGEIQTLPCAHPLTHEKKQWDKGKQSLKSKRHSNVHEKAVHVCLIRNLKDKNPNDFCGTLWDIPPFLTAMM